MPDFHTMWRYERFARALGDVRGAMTFLPSSSHRDGIAIVGMAGRFPGAPDVATFWRNLCAGVESIVALDPASLEDDAALREDPTYVAARAILDDVDRFDAAFFSMHAREAELTDPQHRVLLETCWAALEDAGCDPRASAKRIGIYAGCSVSTYFVRHVLQDRELVESFAQEYQVGRFPELLGSGADFLATRIAYKLDLRGPAMTVQSACSTSLLAVAQACESLWAEHADLMLAGAVSITFPQHRGYRYQDGGMVSRDGHCRTFDADASGTVFGAGAGAVVLKRLADARADGDTIYAVVRGVGMNNDGSSKVGYTAPSVTGQADAVAAALRMANFAPETIDYVECHGTATPLGDPIEVAALAKAFAGVAATGKRVTLGSVKPNVGHLDVAAGMAGLVKTALALRDGKIPGTLNYRSPNPRIDFASTPFDVTATLGSWPTTAETRRAGISAFGVGGTNVHLVLESEPQPRSMTDAARPELLVLSARTAAALGSARARLAVHLRAEPDLALSDVARTLATGRRAFARRSSLVAISTADAAAQLEALVAMPPGTDTIAASEPEIAWLFPGQGSQTIGMGSELYATQPVFRAALDRCADALAPALGVDLRTLLDPSLSDETARAALTATSVAQPAIFSVSYALAQLMLSWGVAPAAMAGHSVGEFVAATLAGVFSLEDALALVAERGRLMQTMVPGAMLAVRLAEADLRPFLDSDLDIAAVNSPRQTVASGSFDAIARLEATLVGRNVLCKRVATSHAFHSALMDPIREPLARFIETLPLSQPTIPFVSTVTGDWIDADDATSPQYWSDHARETVRFSDALQTLADAGMTAYLEVGAGTALASNARQTFGRDTTHTIVSSLSGDDRGELASVSTALGRLWVAGAQPDLATLWSERDGRRISLPTYAFERGRYWIDPPSGDAKPEIKNVPVISVDATQSRVSVVSRELAALLEELSGERVDEAAFGASFLELGFDSLFLGRFVQAVATRFGVAVTFRQLLGDLPSLSALAGHVVTVMPAPAAIVAAIAPLAVAVPGAVAAPSSAIEAIVRDQLATMQQLMRDQLLFLSGSIPIAANAGAEVAAGTRVIAAPQATVAPSVSAAIDTNASRFEVFRVAPSASTDLTAAQRSHVEALIARVTTKTAKSKAYTQRYRAVLADPRVAAGFRSEWKEMVYPIVCERAAGSRLWDLDGNEYIDILNGFGQTAFGHAPDFVTEAVRSRLDRGFAIGPQADVAGEVAERFCAMTGNERVTFCNTGSEAVMAAMRIARTVTGRDRIVLFGGAYHGQFDEVLVKGAQTSARSIPIAPGIPAGSVGNITVLKYATPESLAWVREHASELAAVIVEPVQSRHPALQPKEFLAEIRAITAASGTALVFDEVVTGFRMHPGGMQAVFGIRADLATYGKVVGGGMPIGILAGTARFMDALDGGMWQYGDDSQPEVPPTFFAGTFVRHPLVMEAVLAVLRHLEAHGPELQAALTERTTGMVARLNADLERRGLTSRIETFGSLFFFNFTPEERLAGLLHYEMRDRGVYVQEGFPCFLTTAHTEDDVATIVASFIDSLDALQSAGIFTPLGIFPSVNAFVDAPLDVALTPEQTEVWLAAQMGDDASCAFNESVTVRLSGVLNELALERAWDQIIARHEALRATFAPTGETMRIVRPGATLFETLDFSALAPAQARVEVQRTIASEATTPFDVIAGPLVRATLVRIAPDEHAFVFTAHHLICDGWSINTILNELATLYTGIASGDTPKLGAPLRFSSFAAGQARRSIVEREATEAYWLEQFAETPKPLDLRLDRPRPMRKTYNGDVVTSLIDAQSYMAIKKAGARNGCTLFVTLLASYQLLLGRLGNTNDVVVCVPAAGQSLLDGGNLVGHCVNFLPVRTRWDERAPLTVLMSAARSRVLEAFEHQHYTLGSLVRKKKFARDANRLPLSEVQFNLERLADDLAFGDAIGRVDPNAKAFVNFDLFLNVIESESGLRLDCEYNTNLFNRETIEGYLRSYRLLLDQIMSDGSVAAGDALMDDERYSKEDGPANSVSIVAGPRAALANTTIHGMIEARVESAPLATAIICGDERLTYDELNRRSNQLARVLRKLVLGDGRRIGIALTRSIDLIVAVLGTLKAGFAYVPLDPAHPVARGKIMLREADVATLLVDTEFARAFAPDGVPVVDLAADREHLARQSADALHLRVEPKNPAYVIFTSGSTGTPKGVEVSHRSLVNLVTTMAQEPGFVASDVLLAVTTVAFDMSAFEIYTALCAGGTLVVAKTEDLADGHRLRALIEKTGTTMLQSTPSTWRLLVEAEFRAPAGFRMLSGGECLPRALADRLLEGDGELWNVYGPTETTVYATRGRVFLNESISIGKPLGNAFAYVLDDLLRPVERGALGELYIGGDVLALGYINAPESTASRFLVDPFNGGRMYRTGDAVRMRENGTIETFGRLDDQVKLRGYRIELGEIETALMRVANVSDAAVAIRDDAGSAQLVGYLVPRASTVVDVVSLRERLAVQFPEYMIPSAWVMLGALPLSPNGKLDRRALPIPEFVAPSAKVTLSTPLEVLLGSIWSDVLGRSEIGRDDDIFALGADSIQIFQIVARANRAGIVILARDIMQKRTIGKIVSGLDVAKPGQGRRLSRAPVSRNDESESIQANAR